ncbi:MAG: hypothetical protein ACE5JU_10160 [Candidatus Binatia bacterium]
MRRLSGYTFLLVTAAFLAGYVSHVLYQRWTRFPHKGQGYPVSFSPLAPAGQTDASITLVEAADVETIRGLAGSRARVRGRVFRVGHSAKSNTYFLNFGPSRSSFTGVIFSSALELFERSNIHPKNFEGREIELTGEIKDHPRYGLEMVIENPSQIKLLD